MHLRLFNRRKKEAGTYAPSEFSVFWNKHFRKNRRYDFELHGSPGKGKTVYRGKKAKQYLKESLSCAMMLNGHIEQSKRAAWILTVMETGANPTCREAQHAAHWDVLKKDMQFHCDTTTQFLNEFLKAQPSAAQKEFLSPERQVTRAYSHHSRSCWTLLNTGMIVMRKGLEKNDGAMIAAARENLIEGVGNVRETYRILESLKPGDLVLMRDMLTLSELLERKK